MKVKQFIALFAIIYSSASVNAQSGILQTISSGAKTAASKKATETADKTIDKLLDGSLFKRREGKTKKTDTSVITKEQIAAPGDVAGITVINISGADYTSIVTLADVIKSNKNVSEVQRSFTNGSGTINVNHRGKTEEILDNLLKNSATKYDVAEMSKGKIVLQLKK